MARRGFCARTLTSVGDCEAGTDVSGSWVLSRMHTSSSSAARTECNRLCRSCSHCRRTEAEYQRFNPQNAANSTTKRTLTSS